MINFVPKYFPIMKKLILTALLLGFSAATTSAQNPTIAPIGLVDRNGTIAISQPETTIYITLTIEKESLTAGPYARYAMKYLGVAAPLADKISYEITGCRIDDSQTEQPCSEDLVCCTDAGQNRNVLPVDRLSGEQLSLERRAAEAAAKIFSLRRSRIDLITGEAGENVFGAGLEAALKEIDRIEQEYLSLFFGKRDTSLQTAYFSVVPTKDKPAYIICRFDPKSGLLDDSDLSGTPVLLDITATAVSTEGLEIKAKPTPKDKLYRIAGMAACRVLYKDTQIGSRTIPVYQLGETIAIQNK